MKDLILTLFGTYEPIMTQTPVVTSYESEGVITQTISYIDVVASGVAGVDWLWLAGVATFIVVLYCFLRIVGGLFK